MKIHGDQFFTVSVLRERGSALLLFVLGISAGLLVIFMAVFSSAAKETRKQRQTQAVLAQAKEALLAYAFDRLNNTPTFNGFGTFPCPDTNNFSGVNDLDDKSGTDSSCGPADGSTSAAFRLGRLPHYVAGQYLTDGDGVRLWYAVSNNFKNKTLRITSGNTDVTYSSFINPDQLATFSIRQSDGSQINDVVAVIIASGSPLTRADGVVQNRGDDTQPCSGRNVDSQCTASNYLDIATSAGVTIDNAVMASENANTLKIFHAPMRNTAGEIVSNDMLLPITKEDWRKYAETRLATMTGRCLLARRLNNLGQPALLTTAASQDGLSTWSANAGAGWQKSASAQRIGRIPDFDGVDNYWGSPASPTLPVNMQVCDPDVLKRDTSAVAGRWNSWRSQIFMVSSQYFYANQLISGAPYSNSACNTSGSCLSIVDANDVLIADQVLAAIIFAGPTLPGKTRATAIDRAQTGNFLESVTENALAPQALGVPTPAEKIRYVPPAQRATIPFNDRICYIQLKHLTNSANLTYCSTAATTAQAQACGSFIQCLD